MMTWARRFAVFWGLAPALVGAWALAQPPARPVPKPGYVTPPEKDWDAKHKEEHLRSYNPPVMEIISIHEAYPGHFVQSLHLKASHASKIDKVFGSYAFIEGWAHYCEKMLIDEGFPGDADPMTRAKYRLAQ